MRRSVQKKKGIPFQHHLSRLVSWPVQSGEILLYSSCPSHSRCSSALLSNSILILFVFFFRHDSLAYWVGWDELQVYIDFFIHLSFSSFTFIYKNNSKKVKLSHSLSFKINILQHNFAPPGKCESLRIKPHIKRYFDFSKKREAITKNLLEHMLTADTHAHTSTERTHKHTKGVRGCCCCCRCAVASETAAAVSVLVREIKPGGSVIQQGSEVPIN